MKKQILQRLEIIAKQLLNDQQSWKTEDIKKQVLELYNELVFLEHLEKLIDHNPFSEFEESPQQSVSGVESAPLSKEPEIEQPSEKEETDSFDIDFSGLNEESKPIESEEVSIEEEAISAEEEQTTENDVEDKEEQEAENQVDDEELFSEAEEEKEELVSDKMFDTKEEDRSPKISVQNELELFAASFQVMPEFERKDVAESRKKSEDATSEIKPKETVVNKPKSLNDVINKGLNIGLNDRLAFIKHLFEGRSEDYTRVLSQLETFEDLDEAMDFLNFTVKPDYNHWESKEDYVIRFISIIEKRFS